MLGRQAAAVMVAAALMASLSVFYFLLALLEFQAAGAGATNILLALVVTALAVVLFVLGSHWHTQTLKEAP